MSALHDVLRHLLSRVPGTQEEHDRIASLIDQDEDGESPGQHVKKENQA